MITDTFLTSNQYYCPDCGDSLPDYPEESGKCSCGRCLWGWSGEYSFGIISKRAKKLKQVSCLEEKRQEGE